MSSTAILLFTNRLKNFYGDQQNDDNKDVNTNKVEMNIIVNKFVGEENNKI
jgi:hypothetical protein